MKIAELMTPNPRTVRPNDTLQAAAQAMDELNVGALPVCENGRLVGMVTDRDIVVRSTSAGQNPCTTAVATVMTTAPYSLGSDALVRDALHVMQQHQVRRLPVLDGEGMLAGIVSLGDLAAAGTSAAAEALENISVPAAPDR
jgi:CBS domain-containing protein